MPGRHRQVLRKILACRSPALGGQLFQCPDCPGFHYRYHSCNDRHCPQCGQADADVWLETQRARLLFPVPYFLATFTVPEELRRFIRSHQQIALDLLFAASAQALQDLAANPRRLGAQLGMLGVLHTWSRTLVYLRCAISHATCSKPPPATGLCGGCPTARCSGLIATAPPAARQRSNWRHWNGWDGCCNTSCRPNLPGCGPSAGCIPRPRCGPIACAPSCANRPGSARRNRPRGIPPPPRSRERPPRHRRPLPRLRHRRRLRSPVPRRSIRIAGRRCAWWECGGPASPFRIPGVRHEPAPAGQSDFCFRREHSSSGGVCPQPDGKPKNDGKRAEKRMITLLLSQFAKSKSGVRKKSAG